LFLPFSARPIFDLVWGGALGLLATPFLVRALWRKELALPIRGFLGFSLLVMLLWVWPPLRFLIPILPLLLLGVWLGSPARLRPFWTLSFVLLSLWSATASHSYAKWAETSGFYCPVPTGQEEWKSFQQQLDWVRTKTPGNAVLQANVDPTLFLFTGRHAIRGSHGNASLTWYLDRSDALGSPEQFHKTLVRNGVTHVVDTPWTWFLETKLLTALIEADRKTHPQSWTLLHEAANPNYRIYRFSGDTVGASTR
jgi:hypothetical protein